MSNPQDGQQIPPVPQYGEYASGPITPPPYQQAYVPMASHQPGGQPMYYGQPTGARPLRTADAIVSIVLLVFGFFGMIVGILWAIGLDSYMQGTYDGAGLGEYVRNGPFVAVQAAIIVSHFLLFAISTPLTIVLIIKRKISFWVPLSAGVLATIIFWVALLLLMFSDPALSAVMQNTPAG